MQRPLQKSGMKTVCRRRQRSTINGYSKIPCEVHCVNMGQEGRLLYVRWEISFKKVHNHTVTDGQTKKSTVLSLKIGNLTVNGMC